MKYKLQYLFMINEPSSWLLECLKSINNTRDKVALDLACGLGRHSYILAERGFQVLAVDNDEKKLSKIADKRITKKKVNVENLKNWPLFFCKFDLIIVFNFLFRPIFPCIINSLNKNGFLIYETFSVGHSKFGFPKNQNYLLENEELKKFTRILSLIAYEEIMVENNINNFKKQRIFARNV